MQQQRQKRPISWVWIILAFIFFWPVGIVLLIIRLNSDRTAAMRCGKALGVVSIIVIIFGVFLMLGDLFVGIIFLAAGIVLNILSRRTKKKAARSRQYISLIANNRMTSLDEIASAVGLPFDTVTNDLNNMIREGYFTGLYLDIPGRKIVLPQGAPAQHSAPTAGFENAPAAQNIPQPRVVECKGCGANATLMGAVGTCEYCGGPLH